MSHEKTFVLIQTNTVYFQVDKTKYSVLYSMCSIHNIL